MPGKIRIGTRRYHKDGSFTDPTFPGFVNCVCLTASTKYGKLGPYVVRVVEEGSAKGALIENIWHSTKLLPSIPAVSSTVSRYDKTTAWKWPAVSHVDEKTNQVDMKQWIKWHDALAHNKYPIRYPFSFAPEIRATTLGIIPPEKIEEYRRNPDEVKIDVTSDLLGVADGRKQVYFRYYIPAVKQQPLYASLKASHESGVNLLMIDVDGPRQESLPYYKETYGVDDKFIENHTILVTPENLRIMVNDTRHSCGHTFGLGAALLGYEAVCLPEVEKADEAMAVV
jgi:hypothetical protein